MTSKNQSDDRPKRAWQRMLSGRRLDLLDPSPLDIEIEDIAHGLARVARWNGQTVGEHAYSVAQHALLVDWLAVAMDRSLPAKWQLAALLHDAPEYVVGDLISPFKAALGMDYKAFEYRLQDAIHVRFGLPAKLPVEIAKVIKDADRIAAYFEATRLAGFSRNEAEMYFGKPPARATEPAESLVTPWSTREAQTQFLQRFEQLFGRGTAGS